MNKFIDARVPENQRRLSSSAVEAFGYVSYYGFGSQTGHVR